MAGTPPKGAPREASTSSAKADRKPTSCCRWPGRRDDSARHAATRHTPPLYAYVLQYYYFYSLHPSLTPTLRAVYVPLHFRLIFSFLSRFMYLFRRNFHFIFSFSFWFGSALNRTRLLLTSLHIRSYSNTIFYGACMFVHV